ncbi:haloacid dehalogenase-like hydrolase [Geodermatophilus sp. SYSU D00766]
MTAAGRRQTVVVDLDGTLVAGDSFGAFLRSLLAGHPLRLAAALLTAPVWLPALALGPVRVSAERWLVWLAAVGLDAEAFAAAARSFAGEHAGVAGGRAAVAAVARLRGHLDRGDRVVVATACPVPLAVEVCRVIGLGEVEVVASDLRRTRWGLPSRTVPARGRGKLQALRAAGVALPVDHAYSDSASDLPLLRAARVPHVVDPTPRDLARLRRELGADVDLLRWAQRRA